MSAWYGVHPTPGQITPLDALQAALCDVAIAFEKAGEGLVWESQNEWGPFGSDKNCVAIGGSNSDTPLSVRIDDGQLVIRIGIDRLDGHDRHPYFPALPITDRMQWARDVACELDRDRGDGATPVALLLYDAMKEAMERGSSAIDHKRQSSLTQGY